MKKWVVAICIYCFISTCLSAQILSNDSLLFTSFDRYKLRTISPRSVMSFEDRSIFYKINPFSYISIGLMFSYQRFLSQQLGSECAYELSCSEHAKKSVERYGIFKGLMIGFYQLQSCTPKTGYDFPNHAINDAGEIVNPIEINED